MIARLVRSADFERVLKTRSRASSLHFAVHHVPTPALGVTAHIHSVLLPELSTGPGATAVQPVDELPVGGAAKAWLGAVVPKRHARRSVTRSLLKRQIRAVAARVSPGLPGGFWVVRLRAPFDKARFASAASDQLRVAARTELEGLLAGAVERVGGG